MIHHLNLCQKLSKQWPKAPCGFPRCTLKWTISLFWLVCGLCSAVAQEQPSSSQPGFAVVAVNTSSYPHGYATDICGQGQYTFIANGESSSGKSLWIIDNSDPLKPRRSAVHFAGFCPHIVRVQDNLLFAAPSGDEGPYIFDISDKTTLRLLTVIPGGSENVKVRTLAVSGRYLYVPYQNKGLKIFDIREPKSPVLKGELEIPLSSYTSAIAVQPEGFVYILDSERLFVIDARDRSKPEKIGELRGEKTFQVSLAIKDGYLLIPDAGGIAIYDLADPAQPRAAGRYDSPHLGGRHSGTSKIWLHENIACLLVIPDGSEGGMVEFIDLSKLEHPQLIGATELHKGGFSGVYYGGGRYAYATEWTLGQWTIDWRDKSKPQLAASIVTAGEGHDICVRGNYAYQADYPGALFVWDISDKTKPKLLNYRHHTGNNGSQTLLLIGDYLYFFQPGPLLVFSLKKDPANPALVKTLPALSEHTSVFRQNNYLYTLGRGDLTDPRPGAFFVLDVSRPEDPQIISRIEGKELSHYLPHDPVVVNSHCYYIYPTYKGTDGQLTIINVQDPTKPRVLSSEPVDDGWTSLAPGPENIFFARTPSAILTYDASSPARPRVVAKYKHDLGRDVYRIERHGNYLYTAKYEGGIVAVFDCSNPLKVRFVGQIGVGGHNYKVRVFGGYCFHALLGGLGISKVPGTH